MTWLLWFLAIPGVLALAWLILEFLADRAIERGDNWFR